MDPWLTLPLVLLPFALGTGWMALLGVRARTDFLGWLGWSWGAGTLSTGGLLLLWALAQAPWNRWGVCSLLLLATALLHTIARRRSLSVLQTAGTGNPPSGTDEERRAPWLKHSAFARATFYAALAFVLLSAFDRILIASLNPVLGTDEGRIYAAPAKLIFELPGLAPHYGDAIRHSLSVIHPEYPLLNPLLQVFGFTLSEGIVHFLHRVPIQLFLVGALLLLASGLKRRVHPLIGAALLLLFAATPGANGFDLIALAYSDGMCAFGLLMAVDAWMRFEEEDKRRWIWLAAIGLSVSAASKNEGLLMVLVFLPFAALRLFATRRAHRPGMASIAGPVLVAITPTLLTAWLNARNGFRSDLLTSRNPIGEPVWNLIAIQFGERGWPTAQHVFREVVFNPGNTRLLFAAFFVLLLVSARRSIRGPMALPSVVLTVLFVGFFAVFVASPFDLDWHFRTAGLRVFSQTLATTALWIGVALEETRRCAKWNARAGPIESTQTSLGAF